MTAKYPKGTWIITRPYHRTKDRKKHQCPVCISTIQQGRMARHLFSKHPKFEYISSDIPADW
jgi:hypothetical protein